MRVYHGTSFQVLARILHTNKLHASNNALNTGMENHYYGLPGVFTAETLDSALEYAWASSALKDNMYYRVVLECDIARSAVLKHRRRTGEILVCEGGVLIRNVLLFFFNCGIRKGYPKGADHLKLEALELLPFQIGDSLSFDPKRKSTWY